MASFWIATAILLSPSQVEPAPFDEQICVTVRTVWQGSAAEISAIEARPVPGSFAQAFSWSGCQNLDKTSLIDWHLKFGTERSTTDALTWLENASLPGALKPQDFLNGLDAAWRAAGQAQARIERSGQAKLNQRIALWKSPEGVRIARFADSFERYMLLADAYVTASEFYGSGALLTRGSKYFPLIRAGWRVFYDESLIGQAAGSSPLANSLGLLTYRINRINDLEMRFAVQKAVLGRAPEDLTAAAAVLERHRDVGVVIGEQKFMQTGEVCGSQEDDQTLRRACHDENNYDGRLIAFWRNMARLRLLAPKDDRMDRTFEVASGLLDREWRRRESGEPSYGSDSDWLVVLNVEKAGQIERFAIERAEPDTRRSFLSDALDHLLIAERLVRPATHPGRYRQIAEAYLRISGSIEARIDPHDIADEVPRQAQTFRIILDGLDTIRRAAPNGNGPKHPD